MNEDTSLFQPFGFSIAINSAGRRIWPPDFKKYVVDKLNAGELTVQQVEQNGKLARSLIYKWLAKNKTRDCAEGPMNAFTQVCVDASPMETAGFERSPSTADARCIRIQGSVSHVILPPDYPVDNLIHLVQR